MMMTMMMMMIIIIITIMMMMMVVMMMMIIMVMIMTITITTTSTITINRTTPKSKTDHPKKCPPRNLTKTIDPPRPHLQGHRLEAHVHRTNDWTRVAAIALLCNGFWKGWEGGECGKG